MTNQQRAEKLAAKIEREVRSAAGRGVQAASRFLASRLKEAVSEPAPRRAVRDSSRAIRYYRATTPAVKGAPPRKLSGRMRGSIAAVTLTPTSSAVGVSARAMPSRAHPDGFKYPLELETHETDGTGKLGEGEHPFVKPTVDRYIKQVRTIVGRPVSIALGRLS